MTVLKDRYVCAAGESFDSVARTLYDDERRAAELMTLNPELCGKMIFEGGEEMYVWLPEEDETAEEPVRETAPWRI